MVAGAVAQPAFSWFWISADVFTAVLLAANLLLIVAVHGRRLRQSVRGFRERRFRARAEEILAELDPQTTSHGRDWLSREVAGLSKLERPIAAIMLIERLEPASEEERQAILGVLRDCGAVELLVRATRRWTPWRRALAIKTLGRIGANETVPLLIERVRSDRTRQVRESAVRALGRIGDPSAVPLLSDLLRAPGHVGAGVVYDALVSFGTTAEPSFAGA